MRYVNIIPINGESGAASFSSDPIPAAFLTRGSIVATLAGSTTPDASVKLQGSNDVLPAGMEPYATVTNWADIPNSSVSIGDNGTFASAAVDLGYRSIRVVYTYASGTAGTITVRFMAQGWR